MIRSARQPAPAGCFPCLAPASSSPACCRLARLQSPPHRAPSSSANSAFAARTAATMIHRALQPLGIALSIGGLLIRGSNNAATSARAANDPGRDDDQRGLPLSGDELDGDAGPLAAAGCRRSGRTRSASPTMADRAPQADGTTIVDAVGMSTGSAYKEGNTLSPLGTTTSTGATSGSPAAPPAAARTRMTTHRISRYWPRASRRTLAVDVHQRR